MAAANHDEEPLGCLSPFLTPLKNIFGQDDDTPLPQNDPFYGYNEFESSIARHEPGTLLRSRPIHVKSFIGLKGSSMQSWQLAYTTTGPLGSEITVCTVIVPPNAGKRDKMVVVCPKTDSASPSYRTSWSFIKGNGDGFNAAGEQIFIIPFLDRGYIVILPDYEGQRDAFGCGSVAGSSTLDAIRATLAFHSLQLAQKKDIKVAVWGYSGGAIAAAWAAAYVEEYAPDLKQVLVGVAIGGLPANLMACALRINATPSAGLILGIFQGLANAYPALQAWLDVNLTKQGKEAFAGAKTKSFNTIMLESAQKDMLNATPADNPSFLERHADYWLMDTNPLLDGVPLKIIQENTLLDVFQATKDDKLIPKVPIYMYAGISDEICPIEPIDTLVSTWKEHGANVEYIRVELWLHVGLVFANHSETVEWIQDRLEGKKLKNNSGDKGGTAQATREIADEDSSAALRNDRAEQLSAFFETAFEKTSRLWF